MLQSLHIENFAIIERAELTLTGGLNAITGETGAGKSIAVGALELALGARARADLIRSGKKLAVVEAVFTPPLPKSIGRFIARELDLEWDATEPLIIRREISAAGRSRCFICEQLVNVGDLKRLGELLIDLHGQHEHQSLFRASAQRAALDAFGAYDKLINDYATAYEAYRALERRRDELDTEAAEFDKRLDYLAYQIEEIEDVGAPESGEIAGLEAEEARLANAEALAEAAARMHARLYESEVGERPSVLAALGEVKRAAEEIGRMDASQEGFAARAAEIEALVEDLAITARDYGSEREADPARLNEIIERTETLKRLLRKHGAADEAALLAALGAMQGERERMQLDERERSQIAEKLDRARADLTGRAQALSEARRTAAGKLARAVTKTLGRVAMEKAKFEVRVDPAEDFTASGRDRVVFVLAANPGEGSKPLAETASGGELSRTMLAIKTALAKRDAIPTLVFDEIDAGISGETAARVGELMSGLADSHQIICITHHASIAARAARHLSVRKTTEGRRTQMTPIALGKEERLEELARMMGGAAAGAAGKKLARQLLAGS